MHNNFINLFIYLFIYWFLETIILFIFIFHNKISTINYSTTLLAWLLVIVLELLILEFDAFAVGVDNTKNILYIANIICNGEALN